MIADGVVRSIRQFDLPDLYHVENYQGFHAALYEAVSRLDERDVRRYASRIPKDAHVLDLACGAGRLCRCLVEQGNRVLGLDSSAEMLKKARTTDAGDGRCRFEVADIRDWHGEQEFDFVTLVGLTYSLFGSDADRAAVLRTARSNVRKGGGVLVDYLDRDAAITTYDCRVLPLKLGSQRGFVLIEVQRDLDKGIQLADFYSELILTDRKVVRFVSSTTSHLVSFDEMTALARAERLAIAGTPGECSGVNDDGTRFVEFTAI